MFISFIIIGRNEEKNLKRCIDSIYLSITISNIRNYEIIYVDGDSTDKSIEVASQFPQVKIFRVTGGRNAAVGRNIGAKESAGDVLCFVDGDMELQPAFVAGVWDAEKQDLIGDFLAGKWMDIIDGKPKARISSIVFPGGTFFIRRKIWESVNGMRTKFRTGEESDFGLRLLKKGYHFHRKKEVMVNHYTVPYEHETRIWKRIWDRSLFFSRAVLYRHHLFHKKMYRLMWVNDKTFLLLIATIVATIIYPVAGLILFAIYLTAVLLRIRKNTIYMPVIKMVWYYCLLDTLNLVYFFTFYPQTITEEYVAEKKLIFKEV
jgi:glycosyltransferase involved in cell wall biosynthesis